jgi:hypothetical protein
MPYPNNVVAVITNQHPHKTLLFLIVGSTTNSYSYQLLVAYCWMVESNRWRDGVFLECDEDLLAVIGIDEKRHHSLQVRGTSLYRHRWIL